jgi:predicted transcriptional regulator
MFYKNKYFLKKTYCNLQNLCYYVVNALLNTDHKKKGDFAMPAFPELRALLAKHGLHLSDFAQIIKKDASTASLKLSGLRDFKLKELCLIVQFFKGKGELVSGDQIFFDWYVKNNKM